MTLPPRIVRVIAAACSWLASATAAAQTPPTPLDAVIRIAEIRGTLETGAIATALVDVQNTGASAWPAGGDVRLAYHWLDRSGRMVVVDGQRTLLSATVRPGETTRLCATMAAPAEPGVYILQWEMVREGVAWFAGDPAEQRPIVVTRATRTESRIPPLALLTFYTVTLAHFFLTALWVRRLGWLMTDTHDERLFAVTLIGLGSLLALLQIVTFTVGLSLWRVAAAAVGWHLSIWAYASRESGALPSSSTVLPGRTGLSAAAILDWCGTVVLVTLLVQWFLAATTSMSVVGIDAEHYHVPNAVDFALGANPLNFVATPHLYPMGTSVLAAWVILPLNDPLLIDLTLAPVFLLLCGTLAWLFRQVTGASGSAWIPWLILLLFSTRLLQVSSQMSADLMYATAFLALNAQLFTMWRTGAIRVADMVLTACACGLLLGSKTTGVISAVLIFVIYGAAALLSHRAEQLRIHLWQGRRARTVLVAVALTVAAGGVWPLRNWINYGSPIAPSGLTIFGVTIFAGDTIESGRYYLSMLKDARDVEGYHVVERASFFIREWLGTWFVPLLLGVVPMLFDGALMWRTALARARIQLLVITAVLTTLHLFLLVQAPWTSLEWTRGLALRYALPFFVLWPFLSFLALFPIGWTWYQRFWTAITGGAVLAALCLITFWQNATMPALPALTPLSMLLVFLGMTLLLSNALAGRGRNARAAQGVAALAGLTLVWTCASVTAAADADLRRTAAWAQWAPAACRGAGGNDRYSAVYGRVMEYETGIGRACQRRRFFMASRFDAPMALQPPPYTNLVYDARPRTMVERGIAEHGPGSEPCDYIIASEAELQTDRGAPLVNRLRSEGRLEQVVVSSPYVIFSTSRQHP